MVIRMETYDLWQTPPCTTESCIPKIHYYPAEKKTHDGTVVIFPGGGYTHRAEHEGKGYAEFFQAHGMDAFVVDYRIWPDIYPASLLDARRAVRFVRYHAEKFGIDPHKVAVMGSSAGGNLIGLLCSTANPADAEQNDAIDQCDCMPNAQIHCYSYISMAEEGLRIDWCSEKLFSPEKMALCETLSPETHIADNAPPAFIFHTFADECVNVIHCLRYAEALRKKKIPIPCELHIFPEGQHGMGLGIRQDRGNPHAAQWSGLLWNWLIHIGF
ncbi:MAG: alpha/beta hydrolase [Clostridia bacterium]|nr:alpha/beta hydrolase [Clostridia bacterium]